MPNKQKLLTTSIIMIIMSYVKRRMRRSVRVYDQRNSNVLRRCRRVIDGACAVEYATPDYRYTPPCKNPKYATVHVTSSGGSISS